MVKNRSSLPQIRFESFEGDWNESTMGEWLAFKNGYNAAKEQYGRGKKFINVLDIIENDYITHGRIIGQVDISSKDFEKNEVKYGDILFQRSSETREEVGQANVYLDEKLTATFGGFVIRGRPLKGFDPIFFNSMLKTAKARKDITSRSGGSTRYNIGQGALESILINIAPSIEEQKKIADFLTSIDTRISQLAKKKVLLEHYKKGVMQRLFTQAIRFKDDDGSEYPDWEEKRLGNLCSFIKDGTHGSHADDSTSSYLLLSAKNIRHGRVNYDYTDRRISEEEYLSIYKNYNLQFGDILLSVVGTIGRVAIYRDEEKMAFQRSVAFLRFDLESSCFMYQQFCHADFQRQLLRRQVTSAQPGIYLGDIAKIPVVIPCIQEQTKIAKFLTAIDQRIDSMSNKIQQTKLFKQGLLQQMFV